MRKNPRRILSPQRLPFRHPGAGHSNLANTKGQRNTSGHGVNQGLAEKTTWIPSAKYYREECECPVNGR